MKTKKPKTFPGWYEGNLLDDELPYYTDGRVLVRKGAMKKAAEKILAKRPKGGDRCYNQLDQIEDALTKNKRYEAACEISIVFAVIPEFHNKSSGVAVKVTTAGYNMAGAQAWFNALPLLWLRKHLKHDAIKMYRSQIVFYLGDKPMALLMAVNMPDGTREMTSEEALAEFNGQKLQTA